MLLSESARRVVAPDGERVERVAGVGRQALGAAGDEVGQPLGRLAPCSRATTR